MVFSVLPPLGGELLNTGLVNVIGSHGLTRNSRIRSTMIRSPFLRNGGKP
jgi:hypothetical protein